MRVTSGKYGGRKLVDNKYEHIRPTADLVKQAVFNKLSSEVLGAKILDLFCGTGALGIEALSRGASEAVFVDKDKRSIALTEENLKNLKIAARVICMDFEDAVKSLKNEKFDIILLDPPYKAGLYKKTLKIISDYEILSQNGIIVCEQNREDKIDLSPFKLIDERGYGIKKVSFLSYS